MSVNELRSLSTRCAPRMEQNGLQALGTIIIVGWVTAINQQQLLESARDFAERALDLLHGAVTGSRLRETAADV